MDTFGAIRSIHSTSEFILKLYLQDLNDGDLLVRPVESANHIAWQLGHLICSEFKATEGVRPGLAPKLPPRFLEAHKKECAVRNNPEDFFTKAEYLQQFEAQRAATKEAMTTFTAQELDAPGPEAMRSYAPTIGHLLLMAGTHVLMHVGQFAVVRRKLGKPVLI